MSEPSSIDELVDWQLSRKQGSYESCPICSGHWHGLDNKFCPGAFATPAQVEKRFRERVSDLMFYIDRVAKNTGRTMRQALVSSLGPEITLPDAVLDAPDGRGALDAIMADSTAFYALRRRAFTVNIYDYPSSPKIYWGNP